MIMKRRGRGVRARGSGAGFGRGVRARGSGAGRRDGWGTAETTEAGVRCEPGGDGSRGIVGHSGWDWVPAGWNRVPPAGWNRVPPPDGLRLTQP
jgi:hypothetical protein